MRMHNIMRLQAVPRWGTMSAVVVLLLPSCASSATTCASSAPGRPAAHVWPVPNSTPPRSRPPVATWRRRALPPGQGQGHRRTHPRRAEANGAGQRARRDRRVRGRPQRRPVRAHTAGGRRELVPRVNQRPDGDLLPHQCRDAGAERRLRLPGDAHTAAALRIRRRRRDQAALVHVSKRQRKRGASWRQPQRVDAGPAAAAGPADALWYSLQLMVCPVPSSR